LLESSTQENQRVIVPACVIVAVLFWGACVFFGARFIRRTVEKGREENINDEMQAAPGSDRHIKSLLARWPRSPTLLKQHAVNALRREDWPEALRRAEMFAARAPRSAGAWMIRIDALKHLGRREEALTLLHEAVRRLPREPDVLNAWAYEAAGRKDWAEAAHRFAAVRRVAPGWADAYRAEAEAFIEEGRPDKAEALVGKGLQLQPRNVEMWQAAAWVASRLGKQDEALRYWEMLRAEFPREPAGYLHGAEALAGAGRGEEAAELIRRGHDFFPGNKDIAAAAARLAPVEAEQPAHPAPLAP
jgi:tetratricopeptide (TPR) repeat protein